VWTRDIVIPKRHEQETRTADATEKAILDINWTSPVAREQSFYALLDQFRFAS
jgi:hypothetical protein